MPSKVPPRQVSEWLPVHSGCDHGFQLGEKGRWEKYSLWERATRVNLQCLVPGLTAPGSTCAKPVNLLDIYPTLLFLIGCKPRTNKWKKTICPS